MELQARLLDDDPLLLGQSYRLRYQVYCVERQFLSADDYPDQLEFDAFDRDSVHVGAVDRRGELVATARLVKPNKDGLPLFRYCTLFPYEHALDHVANTVVEVSRVSISRAYIRHREHPPLGELGVSDAALRASAPGMAERRRHNAEPFLALLKAAYYGARSVGATHVIGATDAALHRRLVRFGFPYRVAGPSVDYYGPVAPYIMDLDELDQVILGGQFPALDGFHVGLVPGYSPRPHEHDGHITWSPAEALRSL
jgi:N-acyl amino acid synthase of PEP-CTERM/exosortase system